jgi:hypothetical protein
MAKHHVRMFLTIPLSNCSDTLHSVHHLVSPVLAPEPHAKSGWFCIGFCIFRLKAAKMLFLREKRAKTSFS